MTSSDPDRVAALVALHAADESSNQSVQSATINLVAITVAYLAITSLTLGNLAALPAPVFAAIALPVILLQTYQMVLAASVMRRARSEQALEAELLGIAGLPNSSAARYGGGAQTNSVTNIEFIAKNATKLKMLRWFAAAIAYFGFYLLGLGYTCYVVYETFQLPSGAVMWGLVAAVIYAILWIVLTVVACFYFLVPSLSDQPPS